MSAPMSVIPVVAVLLLTCSCIVPVRSTHFRGAIIQWSPADPVNFNGTVSIRIVYSLIIIVRIRSSNTLPNYFEPSKYKIVYNRK